MFIPYVLEAVLLAIGVALLRLAYLLASVPYRGDLLPFLASVLRSPSDVFEARAAAFYKAGDADNKTTTDGMKSERIMLISYVPTADGVSVKALGTTGNIYDISFTTVPSCSCPAFVFKRTAQSRMSASFSTLQRRGRRVTKARATG